VLGGGLFAYRRRAAALEAGAPLGAVAVGGARHGAGGLAVVVLPASADAPDGAVEWRLATSPAGAAARVAANPAAGAAGGYFPAPASASSSVN